MKLRTPAHRPWTHGDDQPSGLHIEEDIAMDHTCFADPVTLLVGLGIPTTLESAMEAYAFLQDWPDVGRNAAHGARPA